MDVFVFSYFSSFAFSFLFSCGLFEFFFFLAVLGLRCCTQAFQLWQAEATLHCSVQASHCSGFSCCRAQALGARASVVVARGLSSCGTRELLRSMWDLPGPGIKPMSLVLAGEFLTTAPPGKSRTFFQYSILVFLQCFECISLYSFFL